MSPPFSIVHTETTSLIKRGSKSLKTHSLLRATPSQPLVIKHHKCPAQRDGSFRLKTQSNGCHKPKAGLSHAARTNFSELSVSGYIHPRRVHGACASESRRPGRPPPRFLSAAPKQKRQGVFWEPALFYTQKIVQPKSNHQSTKCPQSSQPGPTQDPISFPYS